MIVDFFFSLIKDKHLFLLHTSFGYKHIRQYSFETLATCHMIFGKFTRRSICSLFDMSIVLTSFNKYQVEAYCSGVYITYVKLSDIITKQRYRKNLPDNDSKKIPYPSVSHWNMHMSLCHNVFKLLIYLCFSLFNFNI